MTGTSSITDPSVLLLAPGDNIAVASADLDAGTRLQVAGQAVVLAARLDTGHKFAIRPIAEGERVIKYGAPIGRAIRPIGAGEYVHIHNLASTYIPTYTLDDGHLFAEEQP